MPGVTSELIASKMKNASVKILDKNELINYLQSCKVTSLEGFNDALIITAGAGDIDALVPMLKSILEN